MLRLFSDCIDIGDPNNDGWSVHEWLKRAYAKERVPISQNSITWLLHLTAKEEYVEFSARTVWCALQHALHSLFTHSTEHDMLTRTLALSDTEAAAINPSQTKALGLWLTLRVAGREILPMALNACSALQMRGFDWEEDDVPHAQFVKALPDVYSAWCHAVLRNGENFDEYMRLEFETCARELGWERGGLVAAVSRAPASCWAYDGGAPASVCSGCGDDYSALGSGLVEPARIARAECVATEHRFKCGCQDATEDDSGASRAALPVYAGSWCYSDGDSDCDSDCDSDSGFFDAEDYFDAEMYPQDQDAEPTQAPGLFVEMALQLYRSHGRVWMSQYEPGERLCANCFLCREQYVSEDGQGVDFPPMPESFEGLRVAR
jgi:hypothetical protein